MKITFSSDTDKISASDGKQLAIINEEYFQTSEDKDQAQITWKRAKWLREKLPESINVIKVNDKVLGNSLLLPCSKELMEKFVSKGINEEDLFCAIEKEPWKNAEAIYLCSVILVPEARGKGLAKLAIKKSIEKMTKKIENKKPILFFWGYSEEGKHLAKKISQETGLILKERL